MIAGTRCPVRQVSYIEIYMEKIRDLLDTYHKKVNLPVREDKQRGVYVAGATEEYVTNANEVGWRAQRGWKGSPE